MLHASAFPRKTRTFIVGLALPADKGNPISEGRDVEFKGGRDPFIPMSEKDVETDQRKYAKAVCAFLNTGGGRLYVGVYDKRRLVQGIRLSTPTDEFERSFVQRVRSHLEPKPSGDMVQFNFHCARRWSARESHLANVPPPSLLDDYHHFLERRVVELENVVEQMGVSEEKREGGLLLIEVYVRASDELVFCEGKPYYRVHSSSEPMTVAQIKDVIVRQWQATHGALA